MEEYIGMGREVRLPTLSEHRPRSVAPDNRALGWTHVITKFDHLNNVDYPILILLCRHPLGLRFQPTPGNLL